MGVICTGGKPAYGLGALRVFAACAIACAWLFGAAPTALAHGPVAPVATGYVARVRTSPTGLRAEVIDGYVRMWLRVATGERVVVLDYHGAPYLRFMASGIQVNENSEMYYLNQTPYPLPVPSGLTRRTPPRWAPADGGHAYEWHDGRLQALASIALPPGVSYAGRWKIPLLVNGRRTAITGGLWRVKAPSIVWFWPLVVFLLCSLALWRVRSSELDARTARVLGVVALVALVTACAGRELHGRPGVSATQYVELGLVTLYAGWRLRAIILRRAGFFSYLLIAVVAIWQGFDLLPTLTNGYVLIDLPGPVARAATVTCLGCAIGLALLGPRLADLDELASRTRRRRRAGKHAGPGPSPTGSVT
ncbi:MAG TPA: hypothetical protein VHX66_10485 [Solirubrobacteraceae bacterium]|jgi:hypothetical protein|nr:hypothetical protein [Solirubrobacteraceae bacterium]